MAKFSVRISRHVFLLSGKVMFFSFFFGKIKMFHPRLSVAYFIAVAFSQEKDRLGAANYSNVARF